MVRTRKFKLLSLILIVAILAQLFPPRSQVLARMKPAIASAQPRLPRAVGGESGPADPRAPAAACYTTYFPGVMNASTAAARVAGAAAPSATTSPALAGPDVAIISPRDGWTISGMLWFAVQSIDLVQSVTFRAGSTVLGTDFTPDDGLQIFLDAGALPAGAQELSVTASNPCGQTMETITVNVVPDPPGSGTVGPEGGVFASEIGSLITFPPGSVPAGTAVSVDEKTQQEITDQNGFDWDAMGVTFLGAQAITASAPISMPLVVASAGFGNRVQPGQAVVNYRILPDADGDGVDELVVINTASVAPNLDVISDPVPQVVLGAVEIQSDTGNLAPNSLNSTIAGPPGTVVSFQANGFNPASILGNVATYRSLVDGTESQELVSIIPTQDSDFAQTLMTLIPSLPPGPAMLTLHNESTGSTVGPIEITVEAGSPPDRPAHEVIDESLMLAADAVDALDAFAAQQGISAPVSGERVKSRIGQLRTEIQNVSANPTPEEQQLLNDIAMMIENSNVRTLLSQTGLSANEMPLAPANSDAFGSLITGMTMFGGLLVSLGAKATAAVSTLAIGTVVGAVIIAFSAGLLIGYFIDQTLIAPNPNFWDIPECVPFCGAPTGMGAAPPPGGNGAGNAPAPPPPTDSSANRPVAEPSAFFNQTPGRIIVKVASAAGSAFPFTGATDAGGYFYIPLIPQGEPFVATAIDTLTGQTRTFEGVGPAVGESVFMFFDFFSEGTGEIVELQFGEVISASIDAPGEVDAYSFQGVAGDRVLLRMKGLDSISDPDFHYPAFEVHRPDGTLLCSNPPVGVALREEVCTLDASGTHTLLYSDYTSSNTGPYQLYLQRLNAPTGAQPLDFGRTITGTVDYVVEYDSYSFDGSTGDQVLLRMSQATVPHIPDPRFRVYRPDGTLLCNIHSTERQVEQLCVLDASGAHTILAGDYFAQNTGPYALFVQRLNDPGQSTPIAYGEVASGTLDTAAEAHTYQFSGSTGDHVLVRMFRTASFPYGVAFWPRVRIYRPDGTELCSAYGTALAEATCALDVTGSYTLLASNRQGIGAYDLFIQRTNSPADPTPISYGETVTQSIDFAVELDAFTFDGAGGDQVVFRMTRVSGALDPHFRVYVPDGSLLCQAQNSGNVAEVACALGVSGSHTILVGQFDSLPNTGTYYLHIQRTN